MGYWAVGSMVGNSDGGRVEGGSVDLGTDGVSGDREDASDCCDG